MTNLKPEIEPPRHVAIIMDGNSRWASREGLSLDQGYEAGVKRAMNVTEQAWSRGALWLTLFAFSTENWRRPQNEIDTLMSSIANYIDEPIQRLIDKGVRVRILGDISGFSPKARHVLEEAVSRSRQRNGLNLYLALGYGGRTDIIRATRSLAEDVTAGRIQSSAITESVLTSRTMTAGVPDPDLIIRTGGRSRLSNFMTWQSVYSELYFTDVLWPDFSEQDYDEALSTFNPSERSFGTRFCSHSA